MRKLIAALFLISTLFFIKSSYALLNLELTRGVSGAIPIAIMPFNVQGQSPEQDVSSIIANDFKISGRFNVSTNDKNVDTIVRGKVEQIGENQYRVNFQLMDAFKSKESVLLSKSFEVPENQLRAVAHHISDLIYKQITGVRGVFSTRLAYIVVEHSDNNPRYVLEVSDMDGYNPRALLTSKDPIMSPAWSPNGRQIAYVSFEKQYASIYIHDVVTGARRLVSEFKGINGAPAWSPDGKKLALVLSKDGSPNIYVMNLSTHQLTPLTQDYSINTEPAWSPDGKKIIFTSNRSGGPQIYQKDITTGAISRLTYDGNYNARASFAKDGNHIVMLNRESNLFNIGILDLNSGVFKVLTNSGSDSESPSIAPNGSMVLYGTLFNGQSVLSLVSTDGSVEMRMPARNGEVQDPAWSPFLS